MSFEVFVQCFADTERTGISRPMVRSLFPVIEAESEPDRWRVRYDDRNYCDVSVSPVPADRDFLNAISVSRPCGDAKFWEALLRVLRMGSVFLCWPGSPPVVADETVSASLPVEMTASLGPPRIVSSVNDILRLLQQT